MFEDRARIIESVSWLDCQQIAEARQVQLATIERWVNDGRRHHRLLAFDDIAESVMVPSFQFTDDLSEVRADTADAVATLAAAGMGHWAILGWFARIDPYIEQRPADAIGSGSFAFAVEKVAADDNG